MKIIVQIVVYGIVLAGGVSYGKPSPTPLEKQLKKLEQDMLMAYVMLDFTALSRVYADEYTNTSHDGTVFTKKQVVDMVKSASFRLDSIKTSESRIKVYGSTAVISGIRKYHRAGKILGIVRYTEVWVNRGNRWQCVSGQLTTIQDKK